MQIAVCNARVRMYINTEYFVNKKKKATKHMKKKVK